jgi:hypothetical protein
MKVSRSQRTPRFHQCVVMQPVVIVFSCAYFAAASLTIGAITLSSLVYQSDEVASATIDRQGFMAAANVKWTKPRLR